MGVRRVVPDLTGQDLAASTAFYGDVLGMRAVMDHGWIVTLADADRSGAQISLVTHDETAPVTPDVSVQMVTSSTC